MNVNAARPAAPRLRLARRRRSLLPARASGQRPRAPSRARHRASRPRPHSSCGRWVTACPLGRRAARARAARSRRGTREAAPSRARAFPRRGAVRAKQAGGSSRSARGQLGSRASRHRGRLGAEPLPCAPATPSAATAAAEQRTDAPLPRRRLAGSRRVPRAPTPPLPLQVASRRWP